MDTIVQPKIIGYRQLSEEDADLMNAIKRAGMAFEELHTLVRNRVIAQFQATQPEYKTASTEEEIALGTDRAEAPEVVEEKEAEKDRLNHAEPYRWMAISRTHMQEACMALTRAVAQPSSF